MSHGASELGESPRPRNWMELGDSVGRFQPELPFGGPDQPASPYSSSGSWVAIGDLYNSEWKPMQVAKPRRITLNGCRYCCLLLQTPLKQLRSPWFSKIQASLSARRTYASNRSNREAYYIGFLNSRAAFDMEKTRSMASETAEFTFCVEQTYFTPGQQWYQERRLMKHRQGRAFWQGFVGKWHSSNRSRHGKGGV